MGGRTGWLSWAQGSFLVPISNPEMDLLLLHGASAPALQPGPTRPPRASFIQHLKQHCHWLWVLYRLVCTFFFFL